MSTQLPKIAEDLMRVPVITATMGATVQEVARLMLDHRIGSMVIVDDGGNYRGIVTEQSFLPHEEGYPLMRGTVSRIMGVNTGTEGNVNYQETIDKVKGMAAGEVMESEGPTASRDSPVNVIAEAMAETQRQHVPIIEDGKPIGIVARHDILRLFTH